MAQPKDHDGTPLSFVTSDGLHLAGIRRGGGAPQTVFSPGNGFPVECYLSALAGLEAHSEIHALNPRGLGGSDVPREFDSWEAPLNDLEAYIRHSMRPPVVVAGHSYGAMLSLWLAATAPELVRGVLLLDPLVPVPRAVPEPEGGARHALELIERTRIRRADWPNRESAARSLAGKGGYVGWRDAPFQAFLRCGLLDKEGGGVRLACPPWLETRIYETRPPGKVWEWAGAVQAPVGILRGSESNVANPRALEELAAMLPVAAVLEVKGGHTFAQQHPGEAAGALAFAWRLIMRTKPGEETGL